MKRRGLLMGLAALLPATALAQMPTQPMPPPDSGTAPMPPRQRRPGPADMQFEQLTQRQRRRISLVLAGYGNPPMPQDQAAARWDGMAPRDRRMAMRSYRDAARAAGVQPRRGGGGAMPDGSMPPPPMAPR